MCFEVGRVRVDEARDRLQTKTKHYNLIFSSVSLQKFFLAHRRWGIRDDQRLPFAGYSLVIYIRALNTVLFQNKEGFFYLARQFIIWVSNKDKRIDELDIKSSRKKIQQGFSSAW